VKLQFKTMLLSARAPEDNDLQITWDVTAAANVREYGGDNTTPGELLIEDIEIVDVRCWSIRYGKLGSARPEDFSLGDVWVRLEWLNAILDKRDDWTEAIRIAATREHMRSRDQVRN